MNCFEKSERDRDVKEKASEIADQLKELAESSETDKKYFREVVLPQLYQSYTERFIYFDKMIFTTGSIMIPLSLAAFPALLAIDGFQWYHILMVGLPSFALILAWHLIAESLRKLTSYQWAWIEAIVRVMGIRLPKFELTHGKVPEKECFGVRTVRRALVWFVAVAWGLLLLVTVCKAVCDSCAPSIQDNSGGNEITVYEASKREELPIESDTTLQRGLHVGDKTDSSGR